VISFKFLLIFRIAFILQLSIITIGLAQDTIQPKVFLDLPYDTTIIQIQDTTAKIYLPHKFILPGSERIYLGSFKLMNQIHYSINYDEGELKLLQSFTTSDSLTILYRNYPFPVLRNYHHREIQEISVSDSTDQIRETRFSEVSDKFLEDLDSYQSNLQKSGSISRGIELGSNQDLSLNSGLNLQLSGYITPDVEIVAALTDESTPIQPEGNTQTLNEVDQVYVKLKSPFIGGTIGDFNLKYLGSRYGNLQRKLQGITIENPYKNTYQQFTYGASRGTFHTNQFLGQEGRQGPYQLTGRNGEKEIIVLAGTERVYIDGALQIRGENNDYIIDYSLAQITFTNKRLVTSENRIEIDFEFYPSFQRYGKNFIGGSSRGEKIANSIQYDFRYYREWDDTQNLLEDSAPLTDEEKEALKKAGDDPLAAGVSGATFVGEGSGNYSLVLDTLVSGTVYDSVYKYVGTGEGDYIVTFTGIGIGNGTYQRVRLGVYEFAGEDRGEYLPIKLVPLASEKNFFDFGLGVNLTKTITVNGELAISNYDRNVYSGIDDQNNISNAFQLTTTLQDPKLRFLGRNLGNLFLTARLVTQKEDFSPLDRQLQPEYNYKWNLSSINVNESEKNIETRIFYEPQTFLKLLGDWGRIDRGTATASERGSGQLNLTHPKIPQISSKIEAVSSKNPVDRSKWLRGNFNIQKKVGKITPLFAFRAEDRKVEDNEDVITGFTFYDYRGVISTGKLIGINWNLSYQLKPDYLYNPKISGERIKQADTQTIEIKGGIEPSKRWQGRFSFLFREKDYTQFFEQLPSDSIDIFQPDPQFQDTSWQDRKSRIANIEMRYQSADNIFVGKLNYRVASELDALQEKVYVDVGENRGNYRFDETLQEYVPDPLGNFILLILPTGDFTSVTNIETGLQLQYRPKVKQSIGNYWRRIFNRLSYTGYFKVEEKSTLDDVFQIYILNLNKFHDPNSTLQGAFIVNQDLYFNERNPDWGIQLRTRYRDNLFNQFLDEENNENRITWARSIQLRKRVFRQKLILSLTYRNDLNRRDVGSPSTSNRDIVSPGFIAGFNFRPSYQWRFQLDVETGRERDKNALNELKLNLWDLQASISYSLRSKARATADVRSIIVDVLENPFDRPVPFEMGKGKKEGNSWQWNLRFEYFVSNNITILANYTGRKDAEALRVTHLGKAEVRAFF